MRRSKKVIFCVHCLLNQNARAKSVAKCAGAVKEFLEYCIRNEWGIVPINCPQLMFEPMEREPETKEHYMSGKSLMVNRKVAKKTVEQIKHYMDSGYEVCGIYGVEGSPTCGAKITHMRDKEGNAISCKASGVFFDALEELMGENGIKVKTYDWDIQAKKRLE